VANQRDIKNRINSIKNTKKITSTMEMVSTAKMKKQQNRLDLSKPYENYVNQIIEHLMETDVATISNPLFNQVANPSKVLIVQITGNRGLCGSYNTHIIDKTLKFKDELEAEGIDAHVFSVGKKGINYNNFINEPMYKSMINLDDKFNFEEAAKLGEELKELFLGREFHEIYICYTKVISSSSQKPEMMKLLPISRDVTQEEMAEKTSTFYIFEPNPNRIFSYILPLYLKVKLFTCFLESSFSEHFARRVAMKNATDASNEMVRDLTVSYNRARQAKITNEISEIVSGAAALE